MATLGDFSSPTFDVTHWPTCEVCGGWDQHFAAEELGVLLKVRKQCDCVEVEVPFPLGVQLRTGLILAVWFAVFGGAMLFVIGIIGSIIAPSIIPWLLTYGPWMVGGSAVYGFWGACAARQWEKQRRKS